MTSLQTDAASAAAHVRVMARGVLEAAWNESDGYCFPNSAVYPHQWLWDSCFHAIAWAHLGDSRCVVELGSAMRAQLDNGFVPHMQYSKPDVARGPLSDRSSFTQPPVFGLAARVLTDLGFDVGDALIEQILRGLDYLWCERRDGHGLIYVTHPWETGADDSPRWDSWVGTKEWDRLVFAQFDRDLLGDTIFDSSGAAAWSRRFVAAPAAFNAMTALAMRDMGELLGNSPLVGQSAALAEAMDTHLWNDQQGLWDDLAVVGGGESIHVPTIDGVLPALVSNDEHRCRRALAQLTEDDRFGAPYGPAYTARTHDTFMPDLYWRGPAWPQLNYLLWLAARRWDESLATLLSHQSRQAALTSHMAEFWNPLTGEGRGASPQSWGALAVAY